MTLPVAPIHRREDAEERVRPTAWDTLPAHECPERLNGLKVLVVDDEPDAREVLSTGLGQCGAEVATASSTREALEALAGAKFDALISDIGMPGEDGYELIRRVRELPPEAGGRTPAVALTAYARTEDRLRAMRAGFEMHVSKPVELTELVVIIANLAWRAGKCRAGSSRLAGSPIASSRARKLRAAPDVTRKPSRRRSVLTSEMYLERVRTIALRTASCDRTWRCLSEVRCAGR